ncbi:MAG TPA: histidine kinase, partial [Bacteroidales bacterium]|nr:histidine kinase [Bacteroidales bacterium]
AYLRAQINPHFLFNALNSVSSLIRSNPVKAQETVVELSRYLRQIMQMSKRRFVTVEEEMSHITQLLDIEQVRYSDRLTKSIHISESCNQKEIPSLILQPIFENALKFGLHESTGPATIKGDVWCDEVNLYVSISNNYEKEAHTAKGTGKGLKNVKQRLELIYGKMYRMHISDDGSNFEVRLSIPVKVEF